MYKTIILNGDKFGCECETVFPMGDNSLDKEAPIIISHGVEIFEAFRGKKLGQAAHIARLARWTSEAYNYAMCTVRRDNDSQNHILRKNGWVRLANTASVGGVPIYVMGRNLR